MKVPPSSLLHNVPSKDCGYVLVTRACGKDKNWLRPRTLQFGHAGLWLHSRDRVGGGRSNSPSIVVFVIVRRIICFSLGALTLVVLLAWIRRDAQHSYCACDDIVLFYIYSMLFVFA